MVGWLKTNLLETLTLAPASKLPPIWRAGGVNDRSKVSGNSVVSQFVSLWEHVSNVFRHVGNVSPQTETLPEIPLRSLTLLGRQPFSRLSLSVSYSVVFTTSMLIFPRIRETGRNGVNDCVLCQLWSAIF